MSFNQPSSIEVALEKVVGRVLLSRYYRGYVRTLMLKGSEKVLDFGCGGGNCARFIAKALDRGHLTCLDTSPYWLDVASKRLSAHSNIRYVSADIRDVSTQDCDFFDVISFHFVLHDIAEVERQPVVDSLAVRLRTGGRLHFREPNKPGHGISSSDINCIMNKAGLVAVSVTESCPPLVGPICTGVYVRP